MASFIFEGSSGRNYTYSLFLLSGDITKLPLQAANYIFAAGNGADPVPIWIECANSLRKAIIEHRASEYWSTATDIFGATFLYANFDSAEDGRARLVQKIDLIDRYAAPMNRGDDIE